MAATLIHPKTLGISLCPLFLSFTSDASVELYNLSIEVSEHTIKPKIKFLFSYHCCIYYFSSYFTILHKLKTDGSNDAKISPATLAEHHHHLHISQDVTPKLTRRNPPWKVVPRDASAQ